MTDKQKCAQCGGEPETGHVYPLCANCRSCLTHHPIPRWMWGFVAAMALLCLAGHWDAKNRLKSAIAFQKGRQAEEKTDFQTALIYYGKAHKAYPESTRVAVHLASVQAKLGQSRDAMETLTTLKNRSLTSEQSKKANEVLETLFREPK